MSEEEERLGNIDVEEGNRRILKYNRRLQDGAKILNHITFLILALVICALILIIAIPQERSNKSYVYLIAISAPIIGGLAVIFTCSLNDPITSNLIGSLLSTVSMFVVGVAFDLIDHIS